MEKLTEYVDGKYIRIKGTKSLYPKNERDGAPLSNAIARLAAYEETGLEPEELAQAKKKGRLVVLPCDVGDKLYDVTLGEVREKIVISLSMLLSKSVNHLVIRLHHTNYRTSAKPSF